MDSRKGFRWLKDIIGQKSYLRCLLGLTQLLRGDFHELKPSETPKYYDLVLRVDHPERVPLGLKASVCEHMLKAVERGDPHALEMPDGQWPDANEEAIERGWMLVKPRRAPQPRVLKRPAGRGPPPEGALTEEADECKRRRLSLHDEAWDALLPPEQRAWPDDSAIVSAPSTQQLSPAGAAEEGGLELDPATRPPAGLPPVPLADQLPESLDGIGQTAPSVPDAVGSARQGRVAHLEGHVLRLAPHGAITQGGSYRKWIAACKHHQKCETSRVESRKRGAWPDEPLCLLGLWLSRRAEFDNAVEHMALRWNLSEAEVMAYGDPLGMRPSGD